MNSCWKFLPGSSHTKSSTNPPETKLASEIKLTNPRLHDGMTTGITGKASPEYLFGTKSGFVGQLICYTI